MGRDPVPGAAGAVVQADAVRTIGVRTAGVRTAGQAPHDAVDVAVVDLQQAAQVAERDLDRIGGERLLRVDLAQLDRTSLAGAPGRRSLFRAATHAPGAIVVLVGLQHVQVEGDLELAVGARAREQVADHLRLIDRQRVGRGDQLPARRRHGAHAAHVDPVELERGRRRRAEHLAGDRRGGLPRAAGRVVVLAGRLEVDPVVGPAHGPVDAPAQLDAVAAAQVGRPFAVTGRAPVRQLIRAVPAGHGGAGSAGAAGAVHLHRPPVGGQRRGALPVQDLAQALAVLKRGAHPLGVGAAPVHLGLRDPLRLDAQPRHLLLEHAGEVAGVARGSAVRIGNLRERSADVAFPAVAGEPGRHLAEAVVVVPQVDEPHAVPQPPQGARDQLRRDDLAHVAEVHGAGGGDAGRQHVAVPLAALADDPFRGGVGPVLQPLGVLRHSM